MSEVLQFPERNILQEAIDTADAKLWIEALLQITPDVPWLQANEQTLIGWFSNAIASGRAAAMREKRNLHFKDGPLPLSQALGIPEERMGFIEDQFKRLQKTVPSTIRTMIEGMNEMGLNDAEWLIFIWNWAGSMAGQAAYNSGFDDGKVAHKKYMQNVSRGTRNFRGIEKPEPEDVA